MNLSNKKLITICAIAFLSSILYFYFERSKDNLSNNTHKEFDPKFGENEHSFEKKLSSNSSQLKSREMINRYKNITHQMKEIESIWNKSILSLMDLEKKKEMLSNEQIIKVLSDRLRKTNFIEELIEEGKQRTTTFESLRDISFDTEILERQKYVKFFIQAIMWDENPIKPAVKDAINEIILSDNINEATLDYQKKNLAGDKIELFLALHKVDSDLAESLLNKAQGLTLKAIKHAHTKLNGPNSQIIVNIYK